MSSDADRGTSRFAMTGGSLTNKNGHVFHVTNTNAVITLEGVEDQLELLVEGTRKLEGMFSEALSTDTMVGTGRGWRIAPAEG